MIIFILLSLHIGFIAIITGTGLGSRYNWKRRNFISSVVGGLHCAVWSVAYAGLVIETFGGNL